MAVTVDVDMTRAALLTIDFQEEWANVYADEDLLGRVAKVQDAARQAAIPLIHIRTVLASRYQNGETPLTQFQSRLRERGWAREGAPGSEIHAKVGPKLGELVITKQHEGPFIGTDLEQVLRRLDVHYLLVAGIPTRAAVRNIATDGPNRFFNVTLLADCCNDEDPQVQRVLLTSVLTHQCSVVTCEELLAILAAKA